MTIEGMFFLAVLFALLGGFCVWIVVTALKQKRLVDRDFAAMRRYDEQLEQEVHQMLLWGELQALSKR